MNILKAAICVLGITPFVAMGCSAGDDAASSTTDAITASDIMARANQYLAANITYCGGPRGGLDETSCGEGICNQPVGPWDGYRSDCSGFVSYVWQIPSDPDTATYSYDQSGSQGWTTISIDNLRAGDALVANGHIKLFDSFQGSSAALIYEEYDCNLIAHKQVQGFWRSGNQIWFNGDSRAYHAIRRNALTPTPKPKPGPPTPLPKAVTGCGEIDAGHGLAPGKAIRSCDQRFELVMQGDGNLVEYGPVGAMWSTKTSSTDGHVAEMRADGDFVLYGKTSDLLWSSNTKGHNGARLAIQNDGNVVVYDGSKALWATNTEFPSAPVEASGCGEIAPGKGLVAGRSIHACNGKYTLAMQTDGNLVMYKGAKALWASNTEGQHGYKAVMQGDGNFVVYDWHGAALWDSHTSGHGGASVAVQTDGNLVVYSSTHHALWASNTNQ